MAETSYPAALAAVLQHEGGYVNHPDDPGGATNKGVTQATYDSWRKSQGLLSRSVRQIEAHEIAAIYRNLYWLKVRGPDLPAGIDYATFDLAVNSGPGKAARMLQGVLGAVADGKIGPATLAAARAADAADIINRLCDDRLAFLRGLKTWKVFGDGWTTRVAGVRELALQMAARAQEGA